MSKLIPLEDHILIEPIVEESTTESGFILPSNDDEKPSRWRVVAVWKGKILENWSRAPIDVNEGDTVYFTKYSPDELEVNDGDGEHNYLVVKHSSLLAVEED